MILINGTPNLSLKDQAIPENSLSGTQWNETNNNNNLVKL